jgi:fatty acid desaturase
MLLSSYALILQKNSIYFLIGELIIGFFATFIFLGNHEDLKKYPDSVKESFLNHQLFSCKNYNQNGWFWLIIMGGVNYHTEHHLFPQIPFYNLPAAEPIIREELSKMEKEINYGPVI